DDFSGGAGVNFAERDGLPLFKKYSYFVISDTPFDLINKYAYHLRELRSRTARFSMVVNNKEYDPEIIKAYNKGALDLYGYALINSSAIPLWHMSYVTAAVDPHYAKADPANQYWYEPNLEIFANSWGVVAEYQRSEGIRAYWEVWNEPDQGFATKFPFDGYIRMYKAAAPALRRGNPDAMVGGPAISSLFLLGENNYRSFLDEIMNSRTPIDFVSFHYYDKGYIEQLPIIRGELKKRPYYNTTHIFFTEFNVHNLPMGEWGLPYERRRDNRLQKSRVVPDIFNAIISLNSYTDVADVEWAGLTHKSGAFAVLNPDGTRTPAYHAQYIYMHMPTQQVKAATGNSNLKIAASADGEKAGILIWNTSLREQSLDLLLENIPFEGYTASVFRIDANNGSIFENCKTDELAVLTKMTGLNKKTIGWRGKIPGRGTVYIELATGNTPELEQEISIGTILRNENYYEDRELNAYGDFDEKTSTALIGTGAQDMARGLVAVTYKDIKDSLEVTSKLRGQFAAKSADACLGIRVDYRLADGYTYAVLFADPLTSKKRESANPFGTKKAPDEIVEVDISSFTLDIKSRAPTGWTGQVILCFDIEDTGVWTEAQISLK
ncbi:MAG: hypothetical protein LBL20_04100, partial [Treponema sp.]|nr:hypothetical protein [Treponema sp.]